MKASQNRITFIFLSLCLISSCSKKRSSSIMVDGIIETPEWQDAVNKPIDSNNSLLLKQDKNYHFIAIKSRLPKPLYVDLFLKINDTLYNIHASSQLGDRILSDTSWTDDNPKIKWGFNKNWVANTVIFDRSKILKLRNDSTYVGNPYKESYIPYDGMEFQFSKKNWKLENCLIRIEVRNMIGEDGFTTIVFPNSSERKKYDNWHLLHFN